MSLSRLVAMACLLCLGAAAQAAEAPSRIEADYVVYKSGIRIVTMHETFTRTGTHYDLRSVSKAIGLLAVFKPETITVTSSGAITPQGLRPEHYASKRKLDTDRYTRADFNWRKHQVTLGYRGGVRVESLAAGTQDRLSAMYQLQFLPLQDMKVLNLKMYNNGTRIDDYAYHITAKSSVSVPYGTTAALYLATTPEKDGKHTEIWVDAVHHFPYKLVVTDHDGGQLTQALTGLTITQ